MYNSIQQYSVDSLPVLEKGSENFFESPKDFVEFILNVKESVLKLGLSILAGEFERMDNALRDDMRRKEERVIVRRDEACLCRDCSAGLSVIQ